MTDNITAAEVVRDGAEILRAANPPTRWQVGRFDVALGLAFTPMIGVADLLVTLMLADNVEDNGPADPQRVASLLAMAERMVVHAPA